MLIRDDGFRVDHTTAALLASLNYLAPWVSWPGVYFCPRYSSRFATISNLNLSSSFKRSAPPATETRFMP